MGPTIVRTIAAAAPSRKVAHRIIACLCVGAADGIESGALSAKDARKDLFTEENYKEVKRHRMNKSLKACFEKGLELDGMGKEDVVKCVAAMRVMATQVMKNAR